MKDYRNYIDYHNYLEFSELQRLNYKEAKLHAEICIILMIFNIREKHCLHGTRS